MVSLSNQERKLLKCFPFDKLKVNGECKEALEIRHELVPTPIIP